MGENWNEGVKQLRLEERRLGRALARWMSDAGQRSQKMVNKRIREIEAQLLNLENMLTGGHAPRTA